MMIMVSNRKLNRAMLIIAVVLNSFLVWIYWSYAPVVFADNNTTATALDVMKTALSLLQS